MTLKQDANKLKTMNTMTAGTTPTKLESGATIDLHGHAVKITHTDQVDTTVQYANLTRRTFDTHALNSYLDLGIFPTDTVFERPTAPTERAVITAVTGDCCYQVRITAGSDMPRHETFTYADFIAWHMNNRADIQLETDTDMLKDVLAEAAEAEDANPFETELKAEVNTQSEALQFGQALIDDLRTKLEIANKELQQQSIEADEEKDFLQRELLSAKNLISKQQRMHETVVVAYNEDIKRLEEKAAILNPAPVRKEVCTLIQILHVPEMRKAADGELAAKLSEGWSPLHINITTEFGIEVDTHMRIVTLARDLPATPAPKVAATDAAIYSVPHIGAVPLVRPPVQPPMPAGQVIVNLNQPVVSRPLTNNVNRVTGATKRIPTLAEIEARREKDAKEIEDIMQRGAAAQEAIRRQSAQTVKPFSSLTGVHNHG